jgi:hypothetical protein
MKLRRSGSQRFHGWKNIFSKEAPKVEWDSGSKSVKLSVRFNYDPNSENSFYNYDVFLSLDDLQKVLSALANKGISDSQSEIAKAFSTNIDKLLKIMMCSVGIVATDKKEEPKKA